MEFHFIKIIDLLGTFAFAVSGIRLASGKHFDWFGAYIIGFVTAIGGGTMRDLLLDETPFWMKDASYGITTGAALIASIVFREKLFRLGRTLFLFDTIGLGLFTITGIMKSIEAGFPFWVSIMMGAISGSVGGVIRDVLINEVPLLFRKDLYAVASLVGGLVYFLCYKFELLMPVSEIVAAMTVIMIRILAVKFQIHLPTLSSPGAQNHIREDE